MNVGNHSNVLQFRRKTAPAGQAAVDITPPALQPSSKAPWIALGVVAASLVAWDLLKSKSKSAGRKYARRNPRRRRRAA